MKTLAEQQKDLPPANASWQVPDGLHDEFKRSGFEPERVLWPYVEGNPVAVWTDGKHYLPPTGERIRLPNGIVGTVVRFTSESTVLISCADPVMDGYEADFSMVCFDGEHWIVKP